MKKLLSLLLAVCLLAACLPMGASAVEETEQINPDLPSTATSLEITQHFLDTNFRGFGKHAYCHTIVTSKVKAKSDEICQGLSTDLEKVTAIHDWVTENIYYDYEEYKVTHTGDRFTAEEMLERKRGVCEDFAVLFQGLCWAQKIPCVAVEGGAGGPHAWNLVQVGGQWQWVDATWDTFNQYTTDHRWVKGSTRKTYFLATTEQMVRDHWISPNLNGLSRPVMFHPSYNVPTEFWVCVVTRYEERNMDAFFYYNSPVATGNCTQEELEECIEARRDMGMGSVYVTDYGHWLPEVMGMDLDDAVIPDHIPTIDRSACYGWEMKKLTIPSSVKTVRGFAFNSCKLLTELYIAEGVETIEQDAFLECTALKEVRIADSGTTIEKNAFLGCSALTDIYYAGTKAQWEAMDVSPATCTTVHCSDGDIEATYLGRCTVEVNDPRGCYYNTMNDGTMSLGVYIGYTVKEITKNGEPMEWEANESGYVKLSGLKTTDVVRVTLEGGIGRCMVELSDRAGGYYVTTDRGALTVKANEGYTIKSITKNGEAVTGETAADGSVSFSGLKTTDLFVVTFEKEGGGAAPATGFTDVIPGSFYEDAVKWAVENGITKGTSKDKFSPMQPCNRGQAVTFLWRAAGSPEPTNTVSPFTDVSNPGEYYYKAVLWAVEKGITKGTSKDKFSPGKECDRGTIVTFQYRAAGSPAVSGVSPFTDVSNPSEYYYNAVLWAVQKGITKGTSATKFSPAQPCNRGQIVTFLYRGK